MPALLLLLLRPACAQDNAFGRAGLMLDSCPFYPSAAAMVLLDEGTIKMNGSSGFVAGRHLCIRFFKDTKPDSVLADLIFYPSAQFSNYRQFSARLLTLDPGNKTVLAKDLSPRFGSTNIRRLNLPLKAASLLDITYTLELPFEGKLPDWRFQSLLPVEKATLQLALPDNVTLGRVLRGSFAPENIDSSAHALQAAFSEGRQLRQFEYRFAQLPPALPEPFAPAIKDCLERLQLHLVSVVKGTDTLKDFAALQARLVFEAYSSRPDFMLRLAAPFNVPADYDRRIRSITDPLEKAARIYDLVRRHCLWSGQDTIAAPHTLTAVWKQKSGNSTEMNLLLVRLLQEYGFDASPLLVSTRSNGRIDTNAIAPGDFNRCLAHLWLDRRSVTLDATCRECAFPGLGPEVLNGWGLLISMDPERWLWVEDTAAVYKQSVILLGYLLGDSAFQTNAYVNSAGAAKNEQAALLGRDSLNGLKRSFAQRCRPWKLRHFVVANEYVDSLPLAQEFDLHLPLRFKDNLASLCPTLFALPDTLLELPEQRRADLCFAYRQQYDLISDFSFPGNYDIYLLPADMNLSALNGNAVFQRSFHAGGTNFSLRQSLVIDACAFSAAEAEELSRFLKKVAALNAQQVVLRRNSAR